MASLPSAPGVPVSSDSGLNQWFGYSVAADWGVFSNQGGGGSFLTELPLLSLLEWRPNKDPIRDQIQDPIRDQIQDPLTLKGMGGGPVDPHPCGFLPFTQKIFKQPIPENS